MAAPPGEGVPAAAGPGRPAATACPGAPYRPGCPSPLPGRALWAAALLLALAPLAGCWDRREIEERSISLATGFDLCAPGEGCTVKATRQIAVPWRIPLGGGQGGGERPAETVFVLTVPGVDGPATAQRAQAELHRLLTFGHTRLVAFGEDLARRGLGDLIDYIRRIPEARRLMWVLVAEGRAEDLIRAEPVLERVPALYLSDQIDDAAKGGRIPNVFWGEFLIRLANQGEDPVAPLVRVVTPDRPQIAGLAVFRGDRMVGKLDMDEMATFLELRGARRGAEVLAVPLTGGHADLRIFRRSARHRVWWEEGRVHDRIHVGLEAEVVALTPGLDAAAPALIRQLEAEAARVVARRSQALVRRLQQELGADILAVGEQVRAWLPQVWAQVGGDWPAHFARAHIEVSVHVHVRRLGIKHG